MGPWGSAPRTCPVRQGSLTMVTVPHCVRQSLAATARNRKATSAVVNPGTCCLTAVQDAPRGLAVCSVPRQPDRQRHMCVAKADRRSSRRTRRSATAWSSLNATGGAAPPQGCGRVHLGKGSAGRAQRQVRRLRLRLLRRADRKWAPQAARTTLPRLPRGRDRQCDTRLSAGPNSRHADPERTPLPVSQPPTFGKFPPKLTSRRSRKVIAVKRARCRP